MTIPPTCPAHLYPLLSLFEAHGEQAYPVGGCVRDTLRGLPPHDWDVAVTTPPETTLALCETAGYRTVPTGLKHGTITVLLPLNGDPHDRDGAYDPVECTTCRTEGGYSDGRHPDNVSFTTRIEDDLSRRDFTINAMALTHSSESQTLEVLDLFGGQADLAAGVVRCVGDPDTRFTEDALRILRAVRFAVQLGFEVESNTAAAIVRQSEGLSRISRERIGAEFGKILCSPQPERGVALLEGLGLMPYVLPAGISSQGPGRLSDLPAIFALRMACLQRDMSSQALGENLTSLRLSNGVRKDIQAICSAPVFSIKDTPRGAREWRHATGALAVPTLLVVRAGMTDGHPAITEIDLFTEKVKHSEALGEPVRLSDLDINGHDLIQLGFKPGRLLQDIFCDLLEVVWEHPEKNTKEQLIEEALRRRD